MTFIFAPAQLQLLCLNWGQLSCCKLEDIFNSLCGLSSLTGWLQCSVSLWVISILASVLSLSGPSALQSQLYYSQIQPVLLLVSTMHHILLELLYCSNSNTKSLCVSHQTQPPSAMLLCCIIQTEQTEELQWFPLQKMLWSCSKALQSVTFSHLFDSFVRFGFHFFSQTHL